MELIDKYVWYQEGPGVRKNQYTSSGVKLLNVANLVEGKIDLSTSSRYISEDEANGRYSHFLVDEGDLIIASSGIQVSYFEKKMGIAEKQHLPLCMNTSTIRFKVLDKNIMDIRYFMYFLKSNLFKNQIRRLITGSAQLNFGPSHLKKIKIQVPELKKQQEIVRKLDKVKKIIDIRNNQIIELNELIKSQFVEMFGDIKNSKFDINSIKKLVDINIMKTKKKHKKRDIIKYVDISSIDNLKNEIISYKEYEVGLEPSRARQCLEKGDILISTVRPNLKNIAVNNYEEDNIVVSSGFCVLRVNKCMKEYLFEVVKTEKFTNDMILLATGANYPAIRDKDILDYKIAVPPITLQNQFSEIVKQIDKQKFESMIQLKMMEKIYNIINDRRRYV
jgi:restriction modification system DNA specificity domain protein